LTEEKPVTVALLRHGGSHLIRPIVAEISGAPIIEPGKKGAPEGKSQGPVIVFLRDPRDRIVATYRWTMRREGSKKQLRIARAGRNDDERLAYFITAGSDAVTDYISPMMDWARVWCYWPGALRVHFETLRELGGAEVARVASFLKYDFPEALQFTDDRRAAELFARVNDNAKTVQGPHSKWREWFGPLSKAAWLNHDGEKLLEIMGYGSEPTE
jgi:hypothetical protein